MGDGDKMTLNQMHRQTIRQEQIINEKCNIIAEKNRKENAMQETINELRTENYELETALIAIGREITGINHKMARIVDVVTARRPWYVRIWGRG